MRLETVKIEDLVSPDYNPRYISDEEMEKLKRSITELGYSEPIIVNDVNNVIISGNQRARALKELGTEEIEVIFVHEPVLSREKALNVALNKIDGDWDNKKLLPIFEEINADGLDTALTGFNEFEIEEIQFESNFEAEFDDIDEISEDNYIEKEETEKEPETITCPQCGLEIEV